MGTHILNRDINPIYDNGCMNSHESDNNQHEAIQSHLDSFITQEFKMDLNLLESPLISRVDTFYAATNNTLDNPDGRNSNDKINHPPNSVDSDFKPVNHLISKNGNKHIPANQNKPQIQIHHLALLLSVNKARKVRFYRDGDRFHCGVVYAISKDRYRDLGALINDLNRSLADRVNLPYGVRYIFVLPKHCKVSDIDNDNIIANISNGDGNILKVRENRDIVNKDDATERSISPLLSANAKDDKIRRKSGIINDHYERNCPSLLTNLKDRDRKTKNVAQKQPMTDLLPVQEPKGIKSDLVIKPPFKFWKVLEISDLTDGDDCVCSSFDRFEPLDYTKNSAPRHWNFAKHDSPYQFSSHSAVASNFNLTSSDLVINLSKQFKNTGTVATDKLSILSTGKKENGEEIGGEDLYKNESSDRILPKNNAAILKLSSSSSSIASSFQSLGSSCQTPPIVTSVTSKRSSLIRNLSRCNDRLVDAKPVIESGTNKLNELSSKLISGTYASNGNIANQAMEDTLHISYHPPTFIGKSDSLSSIPVDVKRSNMRDKTPPNHNFLNGNCSNDDHLKIEHPTNYVTLNGLKNDRRISQNHQSRSPFLHRRLNDINPSASVGKKPPSSPSRSPLLTPSDCKLPNMAGCKIAYRPTLIGGQNFGYKPKLVTIIRNGRVTPRKRFKFLLNHKTARSIEQVMDDINSIVRLDTGPLRKLYAFSNGNEVKSLADLYKDDDIFVACGPEKYSRDDFDIEQTAEFKIAINNNKENLNSPIYAVTGNGSESRESRTSAPSSSNSSDGILTPELSSKLNNNSSKAANQRKSLGAKPSNNNKVMKILKKSEPSKKIGADSGNRKGKIVATGQNNDRLRNTCDDPVVQQNLGVHDAPATYPKFISKKYAVFEIIGDGNFAIVKECQNKKTGQYYALKIIDKAKCNSEIERQMIANEVAILRRISHPNIVQLYEEYETNSRLYLVMELVKGGDLFDLIARETKFGEFRSSQMIYDLTNALRYLHYSMNVVHRDIKPENLLVSEYNDGTKVLKLADFGLASHVSEPLYTVCGTPAYVAPEILAETGYGIKIDIWATGVIMYILLCGFPPFDNAKDNQDELFDLILAADVEFPKPFWTNISECAKDLIMNMLQVDPNQRFSALDVLTHPWITSQTPNKYLLYAPEEVEYCSRLKATENTAFNGHQRASLSPKHLYGCNGDKNTFFQNNFNRYDNHNTYHCKTQSR
ncbi:unnamed protein product [Gordionus sp. m RMFG-2023]